MFFSYYLSFCYCLLRLSPSCPLSSSFPLSGSYPPGHLSDCPHLAGSVACSSILWCRMPLLGEFKEMSKKHLLPQKPDGELLSTEAMPVIRQSFLGKALNSWNPNGSRPMSSLFPKGSSLLQGPLQTNGRGLENRVIQAADSLS